MPESGSGLFRACFRRKTDTGEQGLREGHGMFWQGCAHQQQATAQQRLGTGFRTYPDALENQGVLPRQLHVYSHGAGSAPSRPRRRLAAVRRGPGPRQAQPQRQQGQQQ